MTKISFDVDFSEDPEKILQQIQDRAKAEVEKRESKERVSGYLSKLHEKVNEDINTEYKSATDLIKALTPFASPALRDKLSSTSPSGRRKTVSMSKEVFDEIKKLLSEPNPNKAAIGRETGVSVVQVRKVATGGYDEKFGGGAPSTPTEEPADKDEDSSPEPDLPPPSFGDDEPADEPPAPPAPDLPEPPSFGDDEPADEPPAPPAPDLPEPPAPPMPGKPGLTRPPSLGAGKPTLKTGKPGKPSLSLKKGKSKTKGIKLTRPPTPGTPPPADS